MCWLSRRHGGLGQSAQANLQHGVQQWDILVEAVIYQDAWLVSATLGTIVLILLGFKVGAPRSGDTGHGVKRDMNDVINQEIKHYDHNDILLSVGGLNVSALGLDVVHTIQYTNLTYAAQLVQYDDGSKHVRLSHQLGEPIALRKRSSKILHFYTDTQVESFTNRQLISKGNARHLARELLNKVAGRTGHICTGIADNGDFMAVKWDFDTSSEHAGRTGAACTHIF